MHIQSSRFVFFALAARHALSLVLLIVLTTPLRAQVSKLTAADASLGDQFGNVVAFDGDYLIVGALLDDPAGDQSGSAYLFVLIDGVWTEQAKLIPDDAEIRDRFATSGALSGADAVVGSEPGELEDAAREATDGRGADVVLETIGGNSVATLNQSVDVCRRQGKIVVIGAFRKPMEFDFLKPMLLEQSLLLSSCYGIVDGRHDYEVAADLMAEGASGFGDIVTHTVPLEDIQKGFETAYDKSTGSLKVHVEI